MTVMRGHADVTVRCNAFLTFEHRYETGGIGMTPVNRLSAMKTTEAMGETIHNAFFDRDFPKE